MFVEDLPPVVLRVMAFLFGSLWGSFFNVAIYRWPREMSVVSPPSHCPSCGAPVPAWRNVPIFAFVLSRGRAGCCRARLTPRYLLVEVLCGVLALALVERFVLAGPNGELAPRLLETALYFAFVGGLVVATFTDLEWMMIPDEVTLPGAALGLATVGLRDTDIEAMAIGAGAGYLMVQVLFVWSYERLTGHRGMGEGDAKLLLFIGAFTGWQGVLFAVAAGSMQGIVVAAIALATRKPLAPEEHATEVGPENVIGEEAAAARCVDVGGTVTRVVASCEASEGVPSNSTAPEERAKTPQRLRLPFGPLLALAALEWLFFGDRVVEWYLVFFER